MRRILHTLLPLGILLTLALTGVWMRFPGSPTSFEPFYASGFLIFWPLVFTLLLWLLLGLPGLRALWSSRPRRYWLLTMLALAGWSLLSWAWAYTSGAPINRPGASLAASIPFVLALLFSIMIAAAGPPLRWMTAALIVSALFSGIVGGVQVSLQGSAGLTRLGEFSLDPQQSGVAVVQAEGVRWLRAYGLLPHPNILAGLLVVGILATLGWMMPLPLTSTREGIGRGLRPYPYILGFAILVVLLWLLGLTFSRAAWVGLAVGGAVWLVLRGRRIPRWQWISLGGAAALTGLAFGLIYLPFLNARVSVTESIEQRSVADRVIYSEMAWRAIGESPLIGWGMGNFPWRASYYLTFTDYDLRGQQVHNIYLAAWAELGVVGLGVGIVAMGLGVVSSLFGRWPSPLAAAFLACLIAWAIIGLFDHYPWTILQMQLVCWGLLGALQRE
jgi:O-antigen ligase